MKGGSTPDSDDPVTPGVLIAASDAAVSIAFPRPYEEALFRAERKGCW